MKRARGYKELRVETWRKMSEGEEKHKRENMGQGGIIPFDGQISISSTAKLMFTE